MRHHEPTLALLKGHSPLRHLLDVYLTHPTNAPKPHPCYFSQLFHSKLKTMLFKKSYPDCPLLPTSLLVSTPNPIHHSRLIVYLPDSLDLTRCLSILFWTSACE